MSMKKLIITEKQLESLRSNLHESSVHETCVAKVKQDLDLNYEPIIDKVQEGGEYFERPKFKVKASKDEELISAESLYEYLKYKHPYSGDFLKQVVRDWCDGNLDNNQLSKNIPVM